LLIDSQGHMMAKENEDENAENGGDEGAKQGGKKKLFIILLIALVALGAAAGVTWFLLTGDSEEALAEQSASAEPVKGPAEYYKFREPLIVTFNVGRKQRFLQAHITLLTRQDGVYSGLELHLPVLQNRLLNAFGEKDFMAIQTHEGRIGMQEEARQIVNEVLTEQGVSGEIEQVLFTNLVMQ